MANFVGRKIKQIEVGFSAVEDLLAVGRKFGVFFGEIGFGELFVRAIGVNQKEITFRLSQDVFIVRKPLNGAGRDAAILPPKGFGFIHFYGSRFEFGGLEPFLRFLAGGFVEIDGALLTIGEKLTVGRPDGRDGATGIRLF